MEGGLLSLKWNNHKSTFFQVLSNVRKKKESYADVTLACDGKFYPVHKLVLSSCSEYFEQMFEQAQCKHPFIVLKDIRHEELESLLSYMYVGEVNVVQEKLSGLIKAAECLRIKGLAVPDEEPPPSKPSGAREKRSSDNSISSEPKRRRQEDSVRQSSLRSEERRKSVDQTPSSNKLRNSSSTINNRDSSLDNDRVSSPPPPAAPLTTDHHDVKSENFADEADADVPEEVLIEDSAADTVKTEPADLDGVYLSDSNSASENKEPLLMEGFGGDGGADGQQHFMDELLGGHNSSGADARHMGVGGDYGDGAGESSNSGAGSSQQPMVWTSIGTLVPSSPEHEIEFAVEQGGTGSTLNIPPLPLASIAPIAVTSTISSTATNPQHQGAGEASSVPSFEQVLLNESVQVQKVGIFGKFYKCPLCMKEFRGKWDFRLHYRTHTNERPYACSYCPYRAKSASRINKHETLHVDKIMKTANTINPIVSSAHSVCGESKVPVPSFEKVIENASALQVEGPGATFTCPICSKVCINRSYFRRHYKSHTKLHACFLCSYNASTSTLLKKHLERHEKGVILPARHIKIPQVLPFEKMILNPDVKNCQNPHKTFKCLVCGKEFAKETNFRQHYTTHSTNRPHVCPECPYRAFKRSQLVKHMSTHRNVPIKMIVPSEIVENGSGTPTIDEPAEITVDPLSVPSPEVSNDASNTSKTYLPIDEVLMHSSVRETKCPKKSFKCPICQNEFGTEHNFRLHYKTHSEDRPHKCTLCPYRGLKRRQLMKHMSRHRLGNINSSTPKPGGSSSVFSTPVSTKFKPQILQEVSTPADDTYVTVSDEPAIISSISSAEANADSSTSTVDPLATVATETPVSAVKESPFPRIPTFDEILKYSSIRATTSPGKTYKCPICLREFRDKYDFRLHYRKHTNEQPFPCPRCSFQARSSAMLDLHMVKHCQIIGQPKPMSPIKTILVKMSSSNRGSD